MTPSSQSISNLSSTQNPWHIIQDYNPDENKTEQIEMRTISSAIVPKVTSAIANVLPITTIVENSTSQRVIKIPSNIPPANSHWYDMDGISTSFMFIEQIKNFWSRAPKNINENNVVILSNEGKYIGPVIDGLASGIGTINVPFGKYEGGFERGIPSGEGTLTNFSFTLKGCFVNGFVHGQASKSSRAYEYIKDKVIDNRLDTSTIWSIPHTHHYTGQFANGVENGKGHLKFEDKGSMIWKYSHYTGDFKNHKFHGQGTCKYANGDKYEGAWENDKRHGKGTYYYANGDVYEGLWENNVRHGEGILTTSLLDSGKEKYKGTWVNDKRHGNFLITSPFTEWERSEWQNDRKIRVTAYQTYDEKAYKAWG